MDYEETMAGFSQLMEDVHSELKLKYKTVDVNTFKKALIEKLDQLEREQLP